VTREHRATVATTVDAPADVVWDLACATDRYEEWIESTLEVIRADGAASLDATWEERSRICGFWKATILWRVTAFDPPRRLCFEGGGVTAVSGLGFEIEVDPLGDKTDFTLTLWYTPRFGPLGSVIEFCTHGNVDAEQHRSVKTFAILAEREFHEGPHRDPS